MTQYNSLNVKLSNSKLNKFKSAIRNEIGVVLRLSSNMTGDTETIFLHKLLLTNRQVSNLPKAFANHSSADIKLSKKLIIKDDIIRRIFKWITWVINKNRITLNIKCD